MRGAALSYAVCGDLTSTRACVFFHGAFSSYLFAYRLFGDLAKSRGVRLIIPERPGHGLSELPEGARDALEAFDLERTWPVIVEQLMAEVGCPDGFSVVAFSEGAPFGLACAASSRPSIVGQLRGLAIVSGVAPLCSLSGGRPWDDARCRALSACEVWQPVGIFQRFTDLMQRRMQFMWTPGKLFAALSLRLLPPVVLHGFLTVLALVVLPRADGKLMLDPRIRSVIIADGKESTRQGARGNFYESLMTARGDWMRRWEDRVVQDSVFLWHGGNDMVVPSTMGLYMERTLSLPASHVLFRKADGHLSIVTRFPEILDKLFGFS